MTKRLWCVMDLVTDVTTGRLRESAVWSNIGKSAIVWAYVTNVNATTFETMTFVVGGLLLGHEIGARILNQRGQQLERKSDDSPRTG